MLRETECRDGGQQSQREQPRPLAARNEQGANGDGRFDAETGSIEARAPAPPQELREELREGLRGERRTVELPAKEDDHVSKPDAPGGGDEPPPRRSLRRTLLLALALPLTLVVIVGGYLYWNYSANFETTDDAFIAARAFSIAPKISGYITAVPVTDNQHVAAGDVIAHIDDRDYRVALDQAQAQVVNAEANISNIDAQIMLNRHRSAPIRRRLSRRRRRWCSRSSRPSVTRNSHKTARVPFRAPSNTARNCMSSRRTRQSRKQT